ncbi:hypothetical protein [Phyllobacterium myrsinacearum]|uniref:DUF2550 domain-containing protein n=1 Tax=Phyllobacterium myrsinacearum TaxID=28101 RepID=A0A839EI80_9HYPH|nr:hypothetical protein [Phyllobacterium myrsinacearum]MBA8879701.1 hypothetical protein [Phyllobacterium myrsinacearum]
MNMPSYLPVLFIFVAALGVGLTFWLLFAVFRAKQRQVQSQGLTKRPDGGINVPLVAAFGGWKFIPWVASSSSSIAPLLVLHESDLEYRVIRAKRRPYTEVSSVDLRTAIGTVNIVFEFRTSMRTFAANTASRQNAAEALAILQDKGCLLTERARSLLATREIESE